MKLLIILLFLCQVGLATELITAKEARQLVKEHDESLLVMAESDLNLRIQERVEKAANEGRNTTTVEILGGESPFVAKAIKKLKGLGYKSKRDDARPVGGDYLLIGW